MAIQLTDEPAVPEASEHPCETRVGVFRRASDSGIVHDGSGTSRTELRFVDRGDHARQSKVMDHVAEAGKDVDPALVDGSMEPDGLSVNVSDAVGTPRQELDRHAQLTVSS